MTSTLRGIVIERSGEPENTSAQICFKLEFGAKETDETEGSHPAQ
jgi:hypothetical protein